MTIQQLTYVLAVVRYGSFSLAAERCFVSQPTLSAQIAKLEQELDVLLLDRLQKPVVPTPAGKEILDRARTAITMLHDIPDFIHENRRSLSGTLRLGVIQTLSQYLLPLFLKSFLQRYAELEVQIHEKPSDDILDDIQRHRLDLGILALPTASPGLVEKPLFFEKFMAYLPPDHPYIKKGQTKGLELSELSWSDMLLLAEGHCFRDQVIDICSQRILGYKNRLEFETGSLESLKALVDQGLGYTLFPELATVDIQKKTGRQLRFLAAPYPARQIGLVFHPGFIRIRLLKAVEDAIKVSLPEMIQDNDSATEFVPWRKKS